MLTVAALISPPELTFTLVGATLLVMALAIGKVSDVHINPAVTVGLIAARQFPARAGLAYIVAQLVGAFLALGLGQLLDRRLPQTDPAVNALWFEMLGTALFVFVVTRVLIGKLPKAATALGVGWRCSSASPSARPAAVACSTQLSPACCSPVTSSGVSLWNS